MSQLRKCNKGFGECYHCDPEPDPPRNAQTELERLTALLEDRQAMADFLRTTYYLGHPPNWMTVADRLKSYLTGQG